MTISDSEGRPAGYSQEQAQSFPQGDTARDVDGNLLNPETGDAPDPRSDEEKAQAETRAQRSGANGDA